MRQIHLAFLWHQHQPFYKNLVTGNYLLPWVRLHAIKDYVGMLLVLKEFPDIRCTINLVPSLLVQIEEYAAGEALDDTLRLTRKPAEDLDEADRRYILDNFFHCNPARLIDPFPAFRRLYDMRNDILKHPRKAGELLNAGALRDIQVWATLAWFHPLVVEQDPALAALRDKARDFSEDDKSVMLSRQDAVIRQVIPLHKEMADAGQIEISTTPFYHPILPLLCDMECAREAMPNVPMPERRSDMRPDAETQVRRAVEYHARLFGKPPEGMWPAEGSVSEDIIPIIRQHGIRWIATDEGILANSVATRLDRDDAGDLLIPDDLYRPYRLPGEGDTPAILFRDHVLADAIGFQYHHGEPAAGAEHFVARLRKLAGRVQNHPAVVPVFLDGENPWDYYDNAGLTFLRDLYSRLSKADDIRTTTIGDYVRLNPPGERLDRLFAGSWIHSNFSIWIGAEEDRKAWSLVADARETLVRKTGLPTPDAPPQTRRAWEEIYIAEGSDWFWWFGPDRQSDQDYLFDALFRAHVSNVYTLIGEKPPPELERPVAGAARAAPSSSPAGILHVTIDGRTSDPEWVTAGQYAVAGEAAAMRRSEEPPVRLLFFGFDSDNFLLRLDGDIWRTAALDRVRVLLQFQTPWPMRVFIEGLSERTPAVRIINEHGDEFQRVNTAVVRDFLEIACPRTPLAAGPGDKVQFYVEVFSDGASIQRIPETGLIEAEAPPAEE